MNDAMRGASRRQAAGPVSRLGTQFRSHGCRSTPARRARSQRRPGLPDMLGGHHLQRSGVSRLLWTSVSLPLHLQHVICPPAKDVRAVPATLQVDLPRELRLQTYYEATLLPHGLRYSRLPTGGSSTF